MGALGLHESRVIRIPTISRAALALTSCRVTGASAARLFPAIRISRTERVTQKYREVNAVVNKTSPRQHSEFRLSHRLCSWCIPLTAFVIAAFSPSSSDAEELGSVRGVVRYEGTIPKAEAADETGRKRDLFEVHPKTRGLRDAVVYWIDAPAEAAPTEAKERPVVVVDQKEFAFLPHVVSVRSGQPVKFTNSDSANHNVRATTFEPKNEFNVFITTGQDYFQRFVADKKQRPTRLGCDIHPWMSGWVYAFDHPHHAVTDAEGRFELPRLPAGKQRLAIRQPDGNVRREIMVEIVAGKTAALEVSVLETDLMR